MSKNNLYKNIPWLFVFQLSFFGRRFCFPIIKSWKSIRKSCRSSLWMWLLWSFRFVAAKLQGPKNLAFLIWACLQTGKSRVSRTTKYMLSIVWSLTTCWACIRDGLHETNWNLTYCFIPICVVTEPFLLLTVDFSQYLQWENSKYDIQAVTWNRSNFIYEFRSNGSC